MRLKKNGDFIPKFGMKKLFQLIYNYFEDKKIDMEKLELYKNIYESGIYSAVSNNLFLSCYSKKEDILNSINQEKKKIILANAFYAVLSGINPIPFVDFGTYYLIEKKLKRELGRLYLFDIDKNKFLNYSFNQSIDKGKEIIENEEMNNIGDNTIVDKDIKLDKKNNKKYIEINNIEPILKTKDEQSEKSGDINNIEKKDEEKELNKIRNEKIRCDSKKVIAPNFFKTTIQGASLPFFKNTIISFVNICKSSILLAVIGSLIGGVVGAGFIIYEGYSFCKYFENYLKDDGGKEYITKSAENYNKIIESIKNFDFDF